ANVNACRDERRADDDRQDCRRWRRCACVHAGRSQRATIMIKCPNCSTDLDVALTLAQPPIVVPPVIVPPPNAVQPWWYDNFNYPDMAALAANPSYSWSERVNSQQMSIDATDGFTASGKSLLYAFPALGPNAKAFCDYAITLDINFPSPVQEVW